jgi:hypothetical protein
MRYISRATSGVIPIFGSVHQKYKIQASTIYMSGTTIRGSQIKMEKHPASPFKGKNQQRETS